jgi:hypothetical protein
MLKYLRIAVTVLSLTACMLLVALWVRSYWLSEGLHVQLAESRPIDFFSMCGSVEVSGGYDLSSDHTFKPGTWRYYSGKTTPEDSSDLSRENLIKFSSRLDWDNYFIRAPHWALMLLCIPVAIIPWLRWRFSLRTLLIATTLVAVGLGLIVLL